MARACFVLLSLLLFVGCGDGTAVEARRGAALHKRQGCHACHPVDGSSSAIGPVYGATAGDSVSLADGRRVARDDAYLRRAILEPNADIVEGYGPTMPGYADRLQPGEIDALVSFLREAYGR